MATLNNLQLTTNVRKLQAIFGISFNKSVVPNDAVAQPWPLLGGVRFILACIVVAEHLHWFVGSIANPPREFGPFAAVVSFLFISGYSIAASLERSTRGFYRRRIRRIYPAYLMALGLSIVPFILLGRSVLTADPMTFAYPSFTDFLGNAFMLQGFAVRVVDADVALWSLSVECACYLLAPLFFRLRTVYLVLIMMASLAFFAICRSILGLPYYAYMMYGAAFAALLWAWLAGFVFYRYRASQVAQFALILLGPFALALSRLDQQRFSIFTVTACAVVLSVAPQIVLPPRLARTLTWLGDVSYPLYVLHLPVLLTLAAIVELLAR